MLEFKRISIFKGLSGNIGIIEVATPGGKMSHLEFPLPDDLIFGIIKESMKAAEKQFEDFWEAVKNGKG